MNTLINVICALAWMVILQYGFDAPAWAAVGFSQLAFLVCVYGDRATSNRL